MALTNGGDAIDLVRVDEGRLDPDCGAVKARVQLSAKSSAQGSRNGNLIKSVVDAPVANLCVLAGLVFLAIGVVGNISGKIQPGDPGRIAAGVLGLLLLGYGVATHSTGLAQPQVSDGFDKQSTAEPAPRAFTQIQVDTDLLGGDYKGFDASTVECARLNANATSCAERGRL